MKHFVLVAAISTAALMAQTATAGSLADPVVESKIIVEDAENSSSGTALVAVMALLFLVAGLD